MIDLNQNLGFVHSGPGIGDKVVYTSFAENYFSHTGRKLIDIENHWAYDHNPYVLRGVVPDHVFDLWTMPLGTSAYPSLAQRICESVGIPRTVLRHARLYAHEDEAIQRGRVVVHITGISAASSAMPDHVIDHIAKVYSSFEIIQVGSTSDKATPFIDKRGLPLWESIHLLATCEIFIGVDSGPMNIVNCYPKVRKKVVLLRELNGAVPVAHPIRWIDYNWEYFNTSKVDDGISMSYLKL